MRVVGCWSATCLFVLACGGRAEEPSLGAIADAGAGGTGGIRSTGGAPSTGGSADGGAGVAGAGAGSIPSGPEVPAAGDGRLRDAGSFEQSAGIGGDVWDLCPSRAPAPSRGQGSAADGAVFLRFDAPLADAPLRPDGTDAQLAFWLDEALPSDTALNLYFDVLELSDRPPSGELSIAALGISCETLEPLATIPLAELSATSEWQQRCVELRSSRAFSVFGLWVTGTDFSIGLDTFRFGPPCE